MRLKTPNGGQVQSVDLIAELASLLQREGREVEVGDQWVFDRESGYSLQPQLAGIQPALNDGVHTVTTIQVSHLDLMPAGIFEFQHSAGDTLEEAARSGLEQWKSVDFVVLLDAIEEQPKNCTSMLMAFPAKDGHPAYRRRAVLGPVANMIAGTRPPLDPDHQESTHPFCPCCFLTRVPKAFEQLMPGTSFTAIRMFAARTSDGQGAADCRVNGEDWQPGIEALSEYAAGWPPSDYEFRKQYIVLQNMPQESE